MKLRDLKENDELDDSSALDRSKSFENQIKAVLVKLGFDQHDIVEVSVDDSEVEVTIDTGIKGLPAKLFSKLYDTDLADEFFLASLDSANVQIKFKLKSQRTS